MENIKIPFIISIIGPKRTGKTTFLKKWLNTALLKKFRYIILLSPTAKLSGDFEELADNDTVHFIMKSDPSKFADTSKALFDRLEQLKTREGRAPPTLLILDDCGTDAIMNQNSILDKYCIRHRHSELSILAVGHSLRGTCGLPKSFRSQMDMAILFNPNSMSELETIFKEVLFSEHLKEAKRKAIEVRLFTPAQKIIAASICPAGRMTFWSCRSCSSSGINFTEPLVTRASKSEDRPPKKKRRKSPSPKNAAPRGP